MSQLNSWKAQLRFLQVVGLGFALSLMMGCAPTGFQGVSDDGQNKTSDPDGPIAKTCTIDPVKYKLSTQVLGFEMTGSGSFGFNVIGGFLKIFSAFGLKTQLKSGLLNMQMAMYNTQNPNVAIAYEPGKSTYSDFGASFTFDAGAVGADISYYSKTPIGKLTDKALANTFQAVLKAMKNDPDYQNWNVRVTGAGYVGTERRVTIAAGSVAGLVKGDQMDIYTSQENWEDPAHPCQSLWTGVEKIGTAIHAQVVSVVANRATLQILNDDGREIKIGDIAELTPTKANKKRVLGRELRIGQMPPAKINVTGVGGIDIMFYVRRQIGTMIRDNGFYSADMPESMTLNLN